MHSGLNCDRKPPLSDILTEPLNPRDLDTQTKITTIVYILHIYIYFETTHIIPRKVTEDQNFTNLS